jgi:hypothetical protein
MTQEQARLLTEAIETMIRNYFETACVPNRDRVVVNYNDRRVDYARDNLRKVLQSLK